MRLSSRARTNRRAPLPAVLCVLLAWQWSLAGAAAQPAQLAWQPGEGYRTAALPVAVPGKTGFTRLNGMDTGILFTNALADERGIANRNLLSGSGVAAGDVDGDGWCDLFFCGLDSGCRLYRNLGEWKFEDITATAGVGCAGQDSTGAVLADVEGEIGRAHV